MHVNVERLLRETPLSIEPSSLDAVHQRLFGQAKRRAPDHYEIHEELGRGGYGRVFRSIDKRYPREVALKVIPYHGGRQLARLEREARALAGLAHPNIVTVFDKGIADAGVYFLATERVAGTRLDAWMHDPARRLDEILEIFAQAAEGLHHAHQRCGSSTSGSWSSSTRSRPSTREARRRPSRTTR
jgi:serine/threonine protein kinase